MRARGTDDCVRVVLCGAAHAQGIPELSWGYSPSDPSDPASPSEFTGPLSGYAFFWALCGGMVLLTLLLYMALGLVPTPRLCCCGGARADKPRRSDSTSAGAAGGALSPTSTSTELVAQRR